MDDRILRGIKLGKKKRLEEKLEEVNADIAVIDKRMEKTAEEDSIKHIEGLQEKHEGAEVDREVDRQYKSEEVDPAGDDEL